MQRIALYASTNISPIKLVIIAALAALALRMTLVLLHPGFLGIDGGAYFLHLNHLLGDEPTGAGFMRPPLAPGWLLFAFTLPFGDMLGYDLFSVFFSMLPLIPAFYLLARLVLRPWGAAIATTFFSFDLLTAEMLVSGILPLIGFGLIILTMVGVWGMRGGFGVREAAAIAISVALIPYVNQTSAGIAMFALPIFTLSVVYFSKEWRILSRIALPVLIGGLIGGTALHWYGDVMPGSPLMRFPGPVMYLSHWADSSWVQMLLTVPTGFIVARNAKNPALRAIGVLAIFEGFMLLWLSNDETIINIFYRARYFVMPLLTINIAWLISTYAWPVWTRTGAKKATAGLMIGAGLILSGYVFQFQNQAYYSDAITPDMQTVMQRIPDDNEKGIIANGFIFALWVAALEKVPVAWTFSASPPPFYQEQYEHTKCVFGWRTDCDPVESAKAINMGYILLDIRFPYINKRMHNYSGAPKDTWSTMDSPWMQLIGSEGTARLYEVKGA